MRHPPQGFQVLIPWATHITSETAIAARHKKGTQASPVVCRMDTQATQQDDHDYLGRPRRSSGSAPLITLVVDLDGMLTSTDTLMESVVQLVKRHPWDLLKLPILLLKGRAAFTQ